MTDTVVYLILKDAFWAALAALGFAVLFNVPPRALFACMLSGAVGYSVRSILMRQFALSISLATLIAAICIGFIAWYAARHWHMPSTIFSISGSIPLVPGVLAYRTMLGILLMANLRTQVEVSILIETITFAINTALVLGAIALGIITPKLLFLRVKPIV